MKRVAQSFALGVVIMVIATLGYVAMTSIWNRTFNVADRLWYYNGKTLSSAQMRDLAVAIKQEHPERPFQQFCTNPTANPKGYTGALIDETHGIQKQIEVPREVFGDEQHQADDAVTRYSDKLACVAVLPQGLDMVDYTKFVLFATLDPSNWF